MKEISVSKRYLIVSIILGVVIAIGILVIENWPLNPEQGTIPSTSEDHLASNAAVIAIEKIFQVNYQEGKDTWLNRICENSTPAGCELFTVSADRLWKKYVNAKSIVTATALAVQKISDNSSEQVWEMSIILSSPLPGSNKTQDNAFVVIVKTENGWKFDRFLMEGEINAILTRQKITDTPEQEGKK